MSIPKETFQYFIFVVLFLLSLSQSTENGDNSAIDSTGTTQDNITNSCSPGTSIGSFIIDSPNRTSILTVGGFAVIKWHYTVLVKNPPQSLDIKIQLIQEGVRYSWDKYVVKGLNVTNAQGYNWTIPALNDGLYKLRLVPDGKETFNKDLNNLPCFSTGEALPANSGQFKVINPVDLLSYPDRYGPASYGIKLKRLKIVVGMILAMKSEQIETEIVASVETAETSQTESSQIQISSKSLYHSSQAAVTRWEKVWTKPTEKQAPTVTLGAKPGNYSKPPPNNYKVFKWTPNPQLPVISLEQDSF